MSIRTIHSSFATKGFSVVVHATDDCPFVALADDLLRPDQGVLPDDDVIDCRYCIGGASPAWLGSRSALDRMPVTETEVAEGNYKPPTERHDGPTLTPEERFARVAAWIIALDRKVEVRDITHQNKRVAADWLRAYTGEFAFLVDLKAKGGVKSDGQAKGVLNCIRADLLRAQRTEAKPAAAPVVAGAGFDASTIPAGRYAWKPADGQIQFLHIDRPEVGKYAGCTFVRSILGPNENRAGFQASAPGARYKGTHLAALTAIAAAPLEALKLYGRELGHCGHCGRRLTNEESRLDGIGPVCAQKYGA